VIDSPFPQGFIKEHEKKEKALSGKPWRPKATSQRGSAPHNKNNHHGSSPHPWGVKCWEAAEVLLGEESGEASK